MSERTHHRTQRVIVASNGLNPRDGYCVPTAWARALASDPSDDTEVARIFPAVVRKLRASGKLRRGSWRTSGPNLSQVQAAQALGFHGVKARAEQLDSSKTGWTFVRDHDAFDHRARRWVDRDAHERYNHRTGYPTVAQWARRNPDVRRAVLRGTRHAGYFQREADGTVRVFDMGARKRIDHAVILDRAEAPADLAALANPVPANRGRQHKEITMSTHTKQELKEKTVAEIRDVAKGMGVEQIDARRLADGKTPNKEHWIAAILEAQGENGASGKASPSQTTWRIATFTNPQTGREVASIVNKDGTFVPRDRARFGIEGVDEWHEVEAESWRAARDLIAAGEATKRSAK